MKNINLKENIKSIVILAIIWKIINGESENIVTYAELFCFFLIINPFLILLHEIGHTMAVYMFNGEITKITIGKGKTILDFGILEIKLNYLFGGSIQYNIESSLDIRKRNIIYVFGPVSNILVSFLLYIMIILGLFNYSTIFLLGMKFSLLIGIANLLPFHMFGVDTDGKEILYLLKAKKDNL